MLGYMTANKAAEAGFTHEGSYYGIPLWLGGIEGDVLMVATKWAPLECLMPLASWIEGMLNAAFYPEHEPAFMFKVGGEIKPNTNG